MSRLASIALLISLCACAGEAGEVSVRDLAGQLHAPLKVAGHNVHVLIFTSHECPIANGYAPTLARLSNEWDRDPRIQLFLIHVDPDLDSKSAKQHAAEYDLPGTILLDPTHALAKLCGATITPEAVVINSEGSVYRGRIDDQWRRLGSRAPAASQHDLDNAVRTALRGERVPKPHPKAVGCLLPEPRS
jgi:hypothetical protein